MTPIPEIVEGIVDQPSFLLSPLERANPRTTKLALRLADIVFKCTLQTILVDAAWKLHARRIALKNKIART